MRAIIRSLPAFVLLAILLAAQFSFGRLTGSFGKNKPELFSDIPASENASHFMLGYKSTYANYLWIRTMLYFGSHYNKDRDFSQLTAMTDIVTKLNPRFYPAYEFAGLLLPEYTGQYSSAKVILERGISVFGREKLMLPFYMSMIDLTRLQDTADAARYMVMAAKNPEAKPYMIAFAATLLSKDSKTDLARQFLYASYESAENPAVKRAILDKIKSLKISP